MHEYITPSVPAYYKRKIFHSNKRDEYETTNEWFQRVFESLKGCEFKEFTDFMFIDKFIAGLDYETFQKYTVTTSLTTDEVVSIGFDNKRSYQMNFDEESKFERPIDIGDMLAGVDIKVEEDEVGSIEPDNKPQPNDRIEIFDNKMDNQHNDEPTESGTVKRKTDNDDFIEHPQVEIKGFKRDKTKKIICLDCGKCFKQKNSYNYHKRIHTGTNLYYCNVCGKRFVKEIQLKMHMPTHDQDNKLLECYLCASKFDRLHGLRIHFTISHTVRTKRNLKCTICKKAFSKQQDLDLHIKIHRGLIEGHKCQHCDRVFDKGSTLKEHLVVHLNTKEFVCETCGRAFKTKHLLKKHSHSHNDDRRFKCCECGQVLKSTATLKNHLRQHTGEKPYECHLCTKRFVTRPSLIKHLRVHRQERPHGCTVCTKRFATTYHLKVHLNTHTGARPYECNLCSRAFSQLGTLKAHQLKAHTQSNIPC